ncbi:integrase, catalytic region, zinc finger, CCHC-type containing protein [Tanacetum coccineum]
MANEHVPSSATTRSDDQILLFNAWVPIGKGNHVLDLQKKKRNLILRSLWRLCITQTSSELSLHQPMFLPALQRQLKQHQHFHHHHLHYNNQHFIEIFGRRSVITDSKVHIKMDMASTCSSRVKFIAACSYSRLNDFATSRKNDLKLLYGFKIATKALEGGPIRPRWMFPFERYIKKLKGYVRNKAKLEDNDKDPEVSTTSELFALACGPTWTPILINSCVVDGVRYVVHSHDERHTTQNNNICSPCPDGEMYYGQLQEILEFKYLLFKVVSFRVKWFDTRNQGCKVKHFVLRNNMTQIDCRGEAFKNDQYILVTQVKQVFYLEDKAKPYCLNDLDNATLHIDGQSTKVDVPPDIIDVVDQDDDITDDEDALPHDLADSDDEDLINVDDDGVDKICMYADIITYKKGIRHETSTARTPEQNGVVERWNRTLVEAARTMLSAAKVSLFFWAEAIATTCFTQNRSLVIPRHEKTPYHIINARKPSVKFFHIFGSLCYIVRDGENLDKMKEKGDACIFVGYSTQSKAYRVFNKRTRIIVETIHVNFEELPQMASDHVSSDPGPQCLTTVLDQESLSPALQVSRKLDHVIEIQSTHQTQLKYNVMHICEHIQEKPKYENAQFDEDEFINIFSTPVQERGETSSRHVDSSNMHTFYQHHPSAQRWTRDHPLEQVIGKPYQSIRTRRQLEIDGEIYMFTLTVSRTEPKNIKEAMADSAWITAMHEELH